MAVHTIITVICQKKKKKKKKEQRRFAVSEKNERALCDSHTKLSGTVLMGN